MQSRTPDTNILVWLPSPIGDAILCTPALRAIRRHFKSSRIWFLAETTVRKILSPSTFNDEWIDLDDGNPLAISGRLRRHKFSHAILLKNSFTSALAVFLAGIPARVGYIREGRGFLLNNRLHAPRSAGGRFEPQSMIDYYLAIASWLGAETDDRSLELPLETKAVESLTAKLPKLVDTRGPIVVLVPGGAFGPSKWWPSESFARTADWLITHYSATVVLSVAPSQPERQIARKVYDSGKQELINLADRPLSLSELKALFSIADLVITNDTGPRHIAVALGRKVITLFGPNDPAWTDTQCESEIQIVGNVPCAPCARSNCRERQHLCMQAITVEMVCDAARDMFEGNQKCGVILANQEFVETSDSFFCVRDYQAVLAKLGLTSVDAVFAFESAMNLGKPNLARFRSRVQFEIESPGLSQPTTVFLKRYDRPPVSVQLKNWLCARARTSCGSLEFGSACRLSAFGINTPKTICYGEQWAGLFERRSLIMTEQIRDAESLERRLPNCFAGKATKKSLKLRRDFIARLADFVRKFHDTGYRHRDLYFSHIFCGDDGRFHLIDLARAFRPILLRRRFQIKDIAQLYYSAPGKSFSNTDQLRFYLRYTSRHRLSRQDKLFIRRVTSKAKRMARHEVKHGREAPFESRERATDIRQ